MLDMLSIKAEKCFYACQQLNAFWELDSIENLQIEDQWYKLVINENLQKKGHISIVKVLLQSHLKRSKRLNFLIWLNPMNG
jgi:hypothetical protein